MKEPTCHLIFVDVDIICCSNNKPLPLPQYIFGTLFERRFAAVYCAIGSRCFWNQNNALLWNVVQVIKKIQKTGFTSWAARISSNLICQNSLILIITPGDWVGDGPESFGL